MSVIFSIARATARSGKAHFFRALGGPSVALVVIVTLLVLVVGLNTAVFSFLDSNLSALVGREVRLPEGGRRRILASLVQSQMLTGSALALFLIMLLPSKSALGLAARTAGASRAAVAIGELLPLLVATALVAISAQSGVFVFLVIGLGGGVLALIALYLLGILYGVLAILAHGLLSGIGRLVRIGDEGRRAFALIASIGVLGIGLADLLNSSMLQRDPATLLVSNFLWAGEPIPGSFADVVKTLLALAVVLVLLLCAQFVGGNDTPLSVVPRIVTLPPTSNPIRFVSFLSREVLLFLRHPLSKVMSLTLLVFAALLLFGAKAEWIPPLIAAYLIAFLFASGLEVSFGRTSRFHWLYASGKASMSRIVLAKYLAGIATQGSLFIVALLVLYPGAAFPDMALALVPLFLALCGAALFGGTLLPYSDNAAVGISLTSLVVLILEVGVFLLDSLLPTSQPLLGALAYLAMAAGTVALSIVIATRGNQV